MSDRELLELAARAAALPNMRIDGGGVLYSYAPENGFVRWNPLASDGDAFRLAVKLDMDVGIESAFGHSHANDSYEDHGDDPCAATRRAIVREAAEIGRAA